MTIKSARWLHFSDIHTGIQHQDQLWPRFQNILLKDIERMQKKAGPFDFIVFSGDLAQAGLPEEFLSFNEILKRVIDSIAANQDAPPVITIPGNHDLVRPKPSSAYVKAMSGFWTDRNLREALWSAETPEYVNFINEVFGNYLEWRDKAIESGLHAQPTHKGVLPGDSSYKLQSSSASVGVVALNSTWLQLGGGDYLGHLHVDTRQIHSVTSSDPDEWVSSSEINLLVTHHPITWLHKNQPDSWHGEVNPAGRFDAHLFGHMHEPQSSKNAIGGGVSRQSIQAASLLGLEFYADGKHERIQGYSANQIEINGGTRALTVWPRRLIKLGDGQGKLVPDSTQDIDEDSGSLRLCYSLNSLAAENETIEDPSEKDQNIGVALAFEAVDISALRMQSLPAGPYKNVRRIELKDSVNAIRADGAIWVSADWGMGEDGYISAVREELGIAATQVFKLDGSAYTSRQSMIDSLDAQFGISFSQFCDSLALQPPSLLLIQNVSLIALNTYDDEFRCDIEQIASLVTDYASNIVVVLSSSHTIRESRFSSFRLRALDEADVSTYVKDSPFGGERYAKPDAVSVIFNHTDGVPSRIDDALRMLELCSLEELRSSNADLGSPITSQLEVPSALKLAIESLRASDQKSHNRSYDLLLALSSLPQGERLQRVKRFLGPHPFLIDHAMELHNRSLIDTVLLPSINGSLELSTEKSLVVTRPVREYVRSLMDDNTARSFDDAALVLYFGSDWRSGDITRSPTGRRVSEALCDAYEIQNAIALVIRNIRRSISGAISEEIPPAFRLATGLVKMLDRGDHYRSVLSFCEDVIAIIDDVDVGTDQRSYFEYTWATTLRMIGRLQDAKSALLALDTTNYSKDRRERADSELALTYEALNEDIDAASIAQRVIKSSKKGLSGLQARAIIAEQIQDTDQRIAELEKIANDARRQNAHITLHNILLTLCNERILHDGRKVEMLKEVIERSGKALDHYNFARALVKLTKLGGGKISPSPKEQRQLVAAYKYLYHERFSGLFNSCHESMWRILERKGDLRGLLDLFRHSSFIWRLNGRDDLESQYIEKLSKLFDGIVERAVMLAARNGTYFQVRVAVFLPGPTT